MRRGSTPRNLIIAPTPLVSPRLFSGYLRIQNPIMNRPDDQFVELDDIARAIGKAAAREAAFHFRDHITNTCNWLDDIGMKFETFENYLNSRSFSLSNLYFDAYALFDDTHYSAFFRNAGHTERSMAAAVRRLANRNARYSAQSRSGSYPPVTASTKNWPDSSPAQIGQTSREELTVRRHEARGGNQKSA